MTIATLIDLGAEGPDHLAGTGIVSVHNIHFGHSTAHCSCGWTGHRRMLKAAAEQDAWTHSISAGCAVSSPLVIAW